MTTKSALRMLIGWLIAAILLNLLLPFAGIPHAQLVPPAIVYMNAGGRTKGVVIGKQSDPSSNPFKVGDHVWKINYAFRATAPHILGTTGEGTSQRYLGSVAVSEDAYNNVVIGESAPVKYEPSYPDISGIDVPGFGRSGGPGSSMWSFWWIWLFVSLIIGYFIAPLLERFILRENY